MSKHTIIIAFLVSSLAASLGLLGKLAIDKHNLKNNSLQTQEELAQIKLKLGAANTSFGGAEKYIDELETALQDEINQKNALITRYGKLNLQYKKSINAQKKGKVISLPGNIIRIGKKLPDFVPGMLYQAKNKDTLVAVKSINGEYGDVSLTARCAFEPEPNETNSIPFLFQYKLHINLDGELVETVTPSGVINHYFNLWEIDKKGKRLNKLELTNFVVTVKDDRSPKFFWFAPHLDVGLTLSFDSTRSFRTGGSIGVSVMGYGLTKNDLSWRFLRLGLDMAASPGFSLDAMQYNIGEHLPLISNLWISPHLTYMLNRKWALGFLVGAVL